MDGPEGDFPGDQVIEAQFGAFDMEEFRTIVRGTPVLGIGVVNAVQWTLMNEAATAIFDHIGREDDDRDRELLRAACRAQPANQALRNIWKQVLTDEPPPRIGARTPVSGFSRLVSRLTSLGKRLVFSSQRCLAAGATILGLAFAFTVLADSDVSMIIRNPESTDPEAGPPPRLVSELRWTVSPVLLAFAGVTLAFAARRRSELLRPERFQIQPDDPEHFAGRDVERSSMTSPERSTTS